MRVSNGHGGRPRLVLAGERYEHLTVIATRMPGEPRVRCRCDCGREVDLWLTVLRRQRSCGCMTASIHRAGRAMTLEGRFWARAVPVGDCWEWQGARTSHGYGAVSRAGSDIGAHRMAWELTNGAIPDGLMVLHSCDNKPCVRPDHLRLGTASDNLRDTHARHPTYSAMVAAVDKWKTRRRLFCWAGVERPGEEGEGA